MYLLDFNECQTITVDEAGVQQAVKRFFDNDPYYSRPHTGDKAAEVDWNIFSLRYLQIGTFLRGIETQLIDWQGPEPQKSPKLFLTKVKEDMLVREAQRQVETARSSDEWSDLEDLESGSKY